MAAVTLANDAGAVTALTETSGSFTPAAGNLLIALVNVRTGTDAGSNTQVTGTDVGTFTFVRSQVGRVGVDTAYLYVANGLSAAVAQTVTCTYATANRIRMHVLQVSGMSRSGPAAIRQSAGQNNGAAAATPAPVFVYSALTGNPCIGFVCNDPAVPNLQSPPSLWTEPADAVAGNLGTESASRDSGFTGTTVTWGAPSAAEFSSLIAELDTTALENVFSIINTTDVA